MAGGGWKVRVTVAVGALLFLYLVLKYAERRQIYYPTRAIEMTPRDAGMEYEEVWLETADNARLNGWFVKADSARAVLLFCHGNAGNISHRLESIAIFRGLGLEVFIFDYRGYGKSRGRISEKGLYLDARAAYDYLVSTRGVPPEKIVIFGRSLGGNVAMDLAVNARAACVISESAFLSVEDVAKSVYGVRPPRWLLSNHYDALSRIRRIRIPKLIIHSRGDEIVPFSQGKKIFEAASEPKEFFELDGSHNEAFLSAGRAYPARLEEFIYRCIDERQDLEQGAAPFSN